MSLASHYLRVLLDSDGDDDDGNGGWPVGPPDGSPPTKSFEGPWFSTQLVISLVIGIVSFLVFSYSRRKWPLLFAPRTKLKGLFERLSRRNKYSSSSPGFSPHEAHAHETFFGWIMPTLKTSEYTIMQIVGLDAAVVSAQTLP